MRTDLNTIGYRKYFSRIIKNINISKKENLIYFVNSKYKLNFSIYKKENYDYCKSINICDIRDRYGKNFEKKIILIDQIQNISIKNFENILISTNNTSKIIVLHNEIDEEKYIKSIFSYNNGIMKDLKRKNISFVYFGN